METFGERLSEEFMNIYKCITNVFYAGMVAASCLLWLNDFKFLSGFFASMFVRDIVVAPLNEYLKGQME